LPENKKTGNKFVGKITIFPDYQANSAGGMENGRRHAKSQLSQPLFFPSLQPDRYIHPPSGGNRPQVIVFLLAGPTEK